MREKLEKHRGILIAAAACVIVLTLAFIIWWEAPLFKHSSSAFATKAFYSDDDGKSWFIDDVTKVAPFDHGGKPAVRAQIFRCQDGKPFVGYLQQYSEAGKAKIAAGVAAHPGAPTAAILQVPPEIKKPGGAKWLSPESKESQAEYMSTMTPHCPEGQSGEPLLVSPADPDNGSSK